MRLTLELFFTGRELDASFIIPNRLCSMELPELQRLQVVCDDEIYQLGEISHIKIQDCQQQEVILCGNTNNLQGVGSGMDCGRILVEGDVGNRAGAHMKCGELIILGNAGHCLGIVMQGGLISILGNAGDRVGGDQLGSQHGMNDGIILIRGSAGDEAGRKMRRGLIVIGENTGTYAGADMIAGSIFVFGCLGDYAGIRMRRGSLVAEKSKPLLPGFRFSGFSDFLWLRLYLKKLQHINFPVPEHWFGKSFQRFVGQSNIFAKGEILIYDA